MTDLAASIGLAQLSAVEDRRRRRQDVWNAYNESLKELPLVLPPPPEPDTHHAWHLYTPLIADGPNSLTRDRVIAAMRAENIGVGIHYIPVHALRYYRRRFGFRSSDFPNASFIGERTFSLPLSPEMSIEDVRDISNGLARIVRYYHAGSVQGE
jgi:dTDP-4-amino-4,6-dideoxygalactose transaminase